MVTKINIASPRFNVFGFCRAWGAAPPQLADFHRVLLGNIGNGGTINPSVRQPISQIGAGPPYYRAILDTLVSNTHRCKGWRNVVV